MTNGEIHRFKEEIEATYRGGSKNSAKIAKADPRRWIAVAFLLGTLFVLKLAYLFVTQ